jgi:spore germination protein GerM
MLHLSSKRRALVAILIPALAQVFLVSAQPKYRLQATASGYRLEEPESALGRALYVTVDGKERKIFDQAFQAWLINDGRDVVFSGRDGAGGFENEGQSLRIYNVASRATRKILSEYVAVTALQAVRTSAGATALLVKMQDGGLGGSYFAVVDPKRGEVFYRQWAEAGKISGDIVTLNFFREDDFDALLSERGSQPEDSNHVISATRVRSYKQEKIDLKRVLRNRVIFNKPSYLEDTGAELKIREVKIYLWEANRKDADIALSPVTRRVGAAAPLRLALQMLFAGTTGEDEAKGLSSATFGMKFEDVRLRDGVALVKFSQPPNQTNYGSLGPMIFTQAIEKTARQFPTVKKVQICAVGDTLIDSQLEKPFSRCSK